MFWSTNMNTFHNYNKYLNHNVQYLEKLLKSCDKYSSGMSFIWHLVLTSFSNGWTWGRGSELKRSLERDSRSQIADRRSVLIDRKSARRVLLLVPETTEVGVHTRTLPLFMSNEMSVTNLFFQNDRPRILPWSFVKFAASAFVEEAFFSSWRINKPTFWNHNDAPSHTEHLV
jgi:hypothetical protein